MANTLESIPRQPLGALGIYSALNCDRPKYLAPRQRNIENNQSSIYQAEMTTQINSSSIPQMQTNSDRVLRILTKEDYMTIVRTRRRTFVHENFGITIAEIFDNLREDANKSNACHRDVIFEIPDHFDVEKTEKILCEYFTDCGYKPIPDARKETSTKINITLT